LSSDRIAYFTELDRWFRASVTVMDAALVNIEQRLQAKHEK
jgi:hypothetical protein